MTATKLTISVLIEVCSDPKVESAILVIAAEFREKQTLKKSLVDRGKAEHVDKNG